MAKKGKKRLNYYQAHKNKSPSYFHYPRGWNRYAIKVDNSVIAFVRVKNASENLIQSLTALAKAAIKFYRNQDRKAGIEKSQLDFADRF